MIYTLKIFQVARFIVWIFGVEQGWAEEYGYYALLSKLNLKCLRIYNRGLTGTEVRENYEKTTAYHKMLESQTKQ